MRVRFEQGKIQWLAKVHTESVALDKSLRGALPLGLPDTLARGAPQSPLRSRGLTRALVRHLPKSVLAKVHTESVALDNL